MEFEGFTRVKITDLVSSTPIKSEEKKEETKVETKIEKPVSSNSKIKITKQAPKEEVVQDKPEVPVVVLPSQYTKKVQKSSPQPVSIPKEKVKFTSTAPISTGQIPKETVKFPQDKIPESKPTKLSTIDEYEETKPTVVREPEKVFRAYLNETPTRYINPYKHIIRTK